MAPTRILTAEEHELAKGDTRFLAALQRRLDEAAAGAGPQVHCRLGCTECCIGLFDITPLDAWRLRRALAQLARREPGRAKALVDRARLQWELIRQNFPGNPDTGELNGDEAARLAFFADHQELPCPALDPATGACELYHARPVSCRTFGLPIRCGDGLLPPCRLNFVAAPVEQVELCAVDPDPEDEEGHLLNLLGRGSGDTVVAVVLAAAGLATNSDSQPGASPRRRRS